MFINKDLSILNEAPAANITAFQIYRPNDPSIESLLSEWNVKDVLKKKPITSFLAVRQ